MTKSEAAIVSAYTGYLIGTFSATAEYCEKLLGHPIFTHQYPALRDEIKEKSKVDFTAIPIVDSEQPHT